MNGVWLTWGNLGTFIPKAKWEWITSAIAMMDEPISIPTKIEETQPEVQGPPETKSHPEPAYSHDGYAEQGDGYAEEFGSYRDPFFEELPDEPVNDWGYLDKDERSEIERASDALYEAESKFIQTATRRTDDGGRTGK
jgi:hypothetical protein